MPEAAAGSAAPVLLSACAAPLEGSGWLSGPLNGRVNPSSSRQELFSGDGATDEVSKDTTRLEREADVSCLVPTANISGSCQRGTRTARVPQKGQSQTSHLFNLEAVQSCCAILAGRLRRGKHPCGCFLVVAAASHSAARGGQACKGGTGERSTPGATHPRLQLHHRRHGAGTSVRRGSHGI